jgi:hypothetical protein
LAGKPQGVGRLFARHCTVKMPLMNEAQRQSCETCGTRAAQHYQQLAFANAGAPSTERLCWLCTACARAERQRLRATPDSPEGLTRDQLIAQLDQFFATSGLFDICRRCHEQGTGCCPPSCRIIGPQGCASGKTLFCATFLCSALLNALSEIDPELGRRLKWLKRDVGVAEWRVYQMFTRVPASERDPERPLVLPARYPNPGALDGTQIKEALAALADEVLEVRRRWHAQEIQERQHG